MQYLGGLFLYGGAHQACGGLGAVLVLRNGIIIMIRSGLKGKVLYDHIVYKRTDIENAMGLGMPAYNTEYDTQGEITELVDYIAEIL